MRITYLLHARFPTEKAYGRQVAQICRALAGMGHRVTLVVPHIARNPLAVDARTYYGLPDAVAVETLRHFDPWSTRLVPGFLKALAGAWLYGRALRRYARSRPTDLLYLRSPLLLSAALRTGFPVLLELHALPRRGLRRFVRDCNRCARVVSLTSSMRDALKDWGVDPARLLTEGDAVDLRAFVSPPSREEARRAFGLATRRCVVGYVGRLRTLEREKGVRTLLAALALLRSSSAFLGFIVGGPEEDRRLYEEEARRLGLTAEDVRFTSQIDAGRVPAALACCDVLVMPFPDIPHYRLFMSPLKMFEYMAAERPVVTTDLPAVRDVLSEETAFFCRPGDAVDLARALSDVRQRSEEAQRRAANARALVARHTWEERMRRILAGFTPAS